MRLENVSAGYGKNLIIKDFSAEIKRGEIISLIGPNGGGKSTLLKAMSGNLKLMGGTVYLGDEPVKSFSLKDLASKMSLLTTERIKPQHMTSMDVVLSGRLPYTDGFGILGKKDKEAGERAVELMKITSLSDKLYSNLSDGQKQRVLIARAICQEPEYLIMDEPTSYLDIRHKFRLMDVLRNLAKEGVTIIMSLHEPELALDVSDRVILVYEDNKTCIKEPKEVLDLELLKELYGLDDEMYKKVTGRYEAN